MAIKISTNNALLMHGHVELWDVALSSTVPACCSEGCIVEPDGVCEHGFESVLLAEGIM